MKLKHRLMMKAKAKKSDAKKVEGDVARQRLDRPMRMKRADGGRVSEDSKREAAKLREEAAEEGRKSLKDASYGIGSAIIGSAIRSGLRPTKVDRAFGRAFQGVGTVGAVGGGMGAADAYAKSKEADRIEKGQAEPGKEDRKSGGRVGKKC